MFVRYRTEGRRFGWQTEVFRDLLERSKERFVYSLVLFPSFGAFLAFSAFSYFIVYCWQVKTNLNCWVKKVMGIFPCFFMFKPVMLRLFELGLGNSIKIINLSWYHMHMLHDTLLTGLTQHTTVIQKRTALFLDYFRYSSHSLSFSRPYPVPSFDVATVCVADKLLLLDIPPFLYP